MKTTIHFVSIVLLAIAILVTNYSISKVKDTMGTLKERINRVSYYALTEQNVRHIANQQIFKDKCEAKGGNFSIEGDYQYPGIIIDLTTCKTPTKVIDIK